MTYQILKLAVPLLALCIPLVAIIGRQIVQPLARVLAQLAAQQDRLAEPRQTEQLAELHARLERMEHVLSQVVDEQQFQRALQEGSPAAEPGSAGAGALPLR